MSTCDDPVGVTSATIRAASNDDNVRKSLMAGVLKAADLGHLARPTATHRKWVEVLQEEFWMQGDREMALGMQAIPMFDRFAGERIGASQVGFIEVVALPLFATLVEAMPLAKTQLEAVQRNRDYWTKYQEPGKYEKKWKRASKLALMMNIGGSSLPGSRESTRKSGLRCESTTADEASRRLRENGFGNVVASDRPTRESLDGVAPPLFDPRGVPTSLPLRASRFSAPSLVQ
jgi:hypothetical protein